MKKIAVLHYSDSGTTRAYMQAIDQLAQVLVENEIALVQGMDKIGVRGKLAEGVLRRRGEVIGIISEKAISKKIANSGFSMVHIVSSLYEREILIAELSDGYIALPNRIGDMKAMDEIVTRAQPGSAKPYGLLHVPGYNNLFIKAVQKKLDAASFKPGCLNNLLIEKDPAMLIQYMQFISLNTYASNWQLEYSALKLE